MRPDLYFTEEEFIKFIEENVLDDDIRMMFENANLEKDETVMSNLIILTGKGGKKYCVDRTFITGTDYYQHENKEYTLLLMKNNPSLIVKETPREIFELIEKSEAKEKAPIINFIKLTGAEDKTDIYVNANKITAICTQTENVRMVNIQDGWILAAETIEEILAKIEEVTK